MILIEHKAAFPWTKFPKFVLGFLLISLPASIHFFTKPGLIAIGNLSRSSVPIASSICEDPNV